MKAFNKGQAVIHFAYYDRKGTWCFTRAIVKSCGAKKMTLENADTGVMMGNNFEPNADTTYEVTWQGVSSVRAKLSFTLADMPDEEAHATCLKHAALELIDLHEHFDGCIERSTDERYSAAIERSRAELHEPRSLKR